MRQRQFRSTATQNILSALLITSLFYTPLLALQPKPVKAAAPKSSLHARNLAPPATIFAEAWRTLTGFFQSGVNLDTLRGTTPQPPQAYQPWPLPPASYDDPKPTNTANYDAYLTAAVQPNNATGPVGALPLQAPDPSVSNSVTPGLSADVILRRFNFVAPALNLAGRAGLDLALAFSYSNNPWQFGTLGGVFNVERGFPAAGWRLGFGAIQIRDGNGGYFNSTTGKTSIIYLAPDGTRHDLALNSVSGLFESYDGSYLQFNAGTQVLSFPNGTKLQFGAYSYSPGNYDYLALPVKITDRQGNFITIAYKTLTFASNNERKVLDYVIDTAGRRIDFEYTNNRLTGIRQDRPTGPYYFVRLDYLPVTLQTNFTTTDPPLPNGSQVWLLGRLTYPTGLSWRFSYNGYGQISTIAKWAPAINGQGGERQVTATTFGYDATALVSRNDTAENWQGGGATYGSGAYGQRVADGKSYYEVKFNGLTYETNTIDYNVNPDIPVKRTLTTYQHDGSTYTINPRVVASEIWDRLPGGGYQVKNSTIEYTQQQGMWLPFRQYDGAPGSAYRYTETTYTHYPAARLLGLPAQVSVYKGNGTLMSRAQNNYDETGSYTDSNNQVAPYLLDESSAGVTQHEASYNASYTTRGNLTSATQFAVVNGAVTGSRVVKRASYDTNGNLRGEADAAGHRKQIVYIDNYSNKPANVGPTQVYPYTTASADLTAMRGGMQHEYYTGNVLKSFNLAPGSSAELQVVQTSYDFADRPLLTSKPDGGWARTDYWDNLLVVGSAQQIESGKVRFKWELLDGAGHPFKKASDHPDGVTGKYAGQLFAYDAFGRVKDSSNVLAVSGGFTPGFEDASSGWLFTNITYDVFSRMLMAKKPDNNEVHVDYEGCGCAGNMTKRVTDELGNYTETKTDLYGRLAEAVEPGVVPANGHYSKAQYVYDELDRLVEIRQTALFDYYYQQTPTQTRTFLYDGWGRLIQETTPEAGAVGYTYKPNDLVEAVTNANGKTTTYTYDKRNLPTTLAYSDTTPGVGYQYDAWGARTQMTDGEGQTSYSYNNFRQLQSETRTFTGLAGSNYSLSYSYNQGEQVQSVNYQAATLVTPTNGSPANTEDKGSGAAGPFTISGTVSTAQGAPVANVALSTYLPGAIHPTLAYTNSQGQYSFSNLPAAGTYTITPSLAGYVFNPYPRTYANLQASRSDANFTATSNAPQTTVTFDKRVNYAYNTVGALSGVGTNLIGTDGSNTTNVINNLSFKAFGAIRQLNYGNGLQLTMGYNANRQQPISMKVGPNGTGNIVDYTYEYYDATGHNNNRIRSITDGVDGQYSVNYTYDKWNRLTHATAGAYARYYQYDPFGNLKLASGSGGPNPSYTLNYAQNATTAPATNRILSVTENGQTQPFSYDNAGNMTAGDGMSYAYDAANRMVSVNGGALGQYGYDGEGMRVKKAEGGVTTYYVKSNVLRQTLYEVSASGVGRVNIYAGTAQVAILAQDGQFYWLHRNHLRSGHKMTNTAGSMIYRAEFDPHGTALLEWSAGGSQNLNNRKFTGHERDATGLDYALARSYNSGRGRFTQPDPSGLRFVSKAKPESLNRYSYVQNDPINFIDPNGMNLQNPRDLEEPSASCGIGFMCPGIHSSTTLIGSNGDYTSVTSIFVVSPGGGTQGNTGGGATTLSAAQQKIKDWFLTHKNCENLLKSKIDSAIKADTFTHPSEGDDLWGKKLSELGFMADDFPASTGVDVQRMTLGQYLSRNGTLGLANPRTGKIYISPNNNGIAPADSQLTYVHEALHLAFNGDHAAIARALGLPTNDLFNERSYSALIDDYLRKDCTK